MEITKKQRCMPNNSASPPLSMHQNSHTISKERPKIRIIHIFAPEIIKTDVANFRELVQRLTGKPTDGDQKGYSSTKKNKPRNPFARSREFTEPSEKPAVTKNMDLRTGFMSLEQCRERVKEEESQIWRSGENSGGFLGGFADLDGFMQELGEFPLFPQLDASHHMHFLEETPLS